MLPDFLREVVVIRAKADIIKVRRSRLLYETRHGLHSNQR